jgi:hypothetical protein
MSEERMIRVWRFHDAPEELRALSDNGGDEDWLAIIPVDLASEWIPWLDGGSRVGFGVCEVLIYSLPDGSKVRIGVHA